MDKMESIIDLNLLFEREIVEQFEKVAFANETTARDVLNDFMKDYIVSNGHPEQVANRWSWNKQDESISTQGKERTMARQMIKKPKNGGNDI